MSGSYEIAGCVVCAAPAGRATELAGRDAIRRQIESLWTFHLRRLRPGAPPRELIDRIAFSQRPPVRVVECDACGTVYRSPRERERMLLELYADERPDASALRALLASQLRFYRRRAARLARLLRPGARVLEVGSYVGAFLEAARERGLGAAGVDVNDATNEFARSRGFDVTTGRIEDVPPETAAFDAVAIWNCLDQLADPRATLLHARSLLAEHGLLAIRVPNGALYAAAARRGPDRLGRWALASNNLLGFPYRTGFTPASLTGLLDDVGFRVRHLRGSVLVPLHGSWTRRWTALEQRAGRVLMRTLLPRRYAPWFEVYARRTVDPDR